MLSLRIEIYDKMSYNIVVSKNKANLEGIFVGTLIAALIIVGVILFFNKRNNKKKEEKEKQILKMFNTKIQNCFEVVFPEYYFERLFLSWGNIESNDDIPNMMNASRKMFEEAVRGFDPFLEAVNVLEQKIENSLLFYSNAKYEECIKNEGAEIIENKISQEIIKTLPLISLLKEQLSNYQYLYSLATRINNCHQEIFGGLKFENSKIENECDRIYYEKSVDKAKKAYLLAMEEQWKNICAEYPELNSEYYHKKFLQLVSEDTATFQGWKIFYFKKFIKIRDDIGLTNMWNKMTEFAETVINKPVLDLIKNQESKYLSICEISDFSSEEISRIVDLYKDGIIKGVYLKSKDPKYKE